MKYFLKIIFGPGLVLLLFSCTEKFLVELPKNQSKIVIQALVTDSPGPYFVRITRTSDSVRMPQFGKADAEAVLHALVVISSSDGITDTLQPSPFHHQSFYFDYGDSLLGYYCTKNWTGKAGQKYYLDIYKDGKNYHSEDIMLPTLKIDSVTFKYYSSNIKQIQEGYLPTFYFNDNCTNSGYYMARGFTRQYWIINIFYYGDFLFSLFTERNITDCSAGLYSQGNPDWPYIYEDNGDTCSLVIYSLSKTAYYFQTNLLKQLISDGGTFKPAPATPVGNISGDAIGIFKVSSVCEYVVPHIP
jgi:Domain of unknown function (DUF4249)